MSPSLEKRGEGRFFENLLLAARVRRPLPVIHGIGIDIVKVERLRRSVESSGRRFLEKVFTEGEISYCSARRDPYPHYAARFAAKEAFVKALPHEEALSIKDIEVVNDERGRPSVKASGRAGEMLKARGVGRVHLSLTHERDYAAAVVVLEG